MNIHYKIVEVWPSDHLIVARYWTDEITEEFLASDTNRKDDGTPVRCRTDISINLPIPEPTPQEIDVIIKNTAPINFLESLEKIKNPDINTDMGNRISIINVQKTITADKLLVARTVNPNKMLLERLEKPLEELTKDEIQKLIG
jgi:hypothetical protein